MKPNEKTSPATATPTAQNLPESCAKLATHLKACYPSSQFTAPGTERALVEALYFATDAAKLVARGLKIEAKLAFAKGDTAEYERLMELSRSYK